jgi:hypothetical protein
VILMFIHELNFLNNMLYAYFNSVNSVYKLIIFTLKCCIFPHSTEIIFSAIANRLCKAIPKLSLGLNSGNGDWRKINFVYILAFTLYSVCLSVSSKELTRIRFFDVASNFGKEDKINSRLILCILSWFNHCIINIMMVLRTTILDGTVKVYC